MRLLTPATSGLICTVAVFVFTLALATSQVVAHPPTEPDHGVDGADFCTLWAGDDDGGPIAVSTVANHTNESATLCALAAVTDIPLDTPPAAAAEWNRGAIRLFPPTDGTRSVHPPDATLNSGRFITDAYVAIFALTPSTRARLSPTEQPLYIPPQGTVSGTVDYRIAVPPDDTEGGTRVYWTLIDHEITETRVQVDGRVDATAPGNHTPRLAYTLDPTTDGARSLTVAADIDVTLRQRIERCTAYGAGTCVAWNETVTTLTETLTVEETVDVVAYDLALDGYRATYPNGDLGLVVSATQPWLGFTHPDGEVRGVWRLYAARDDGWDRLVTSTETGQTVAHSPLHPVQVTAYPSVAGAVSTSRPAVTILETDGRTVAPPALPESVTLETGERPYVASDTLVTRIRTAEHALGTVTAHGLVQGVSVTNRTASFTPIPIRRSDLSLAVVDTTSETVTLRVTLRDATTGEPIDTARHGGTVYLQDREVNTTATGDVTVTLPRTQGGISARFEPGPWWEATTGYVGDSETLYVRETVPDVLADLSRLALPVTLFLLSAVLIDRITGWRLWPPWRGL